MRSVNCFTNTPPRGCCLFVIKPIFCRRCTLGALRANVLLRPCRSCGLRAGFGYSSGITLQNTALALVEMA